MPIKVNISKKETGHFVVAVEGRLDSETAPQCEAEIKHLLVSSTRSLTFDFKHLDYISSMGLRVIVGAMKAIAKQKGRVVVRNAQPPIAKVFEIAGLIPADIAESERSADIFLDAIQRKEAVKEQDVSD
ncbi:MAG: STAS domain-containing protein [Verrucomicrobia bacterium]|nr:STAS domain-containing protein [Verrucomicrobiota bacterium]MBU1736178.1 STAS domain-containing protein [Verrucomicrobiota bacterium]MBU1856778.1 STAS domain-containing protein [Verrucomicrobiota bacterium]